MLESAHSTQIDNIGNVCFKLFTRFKFGLKKTKLNKKMNKLWESLERKWEQIIFEYTNWKNMDVLLDTFVQEGNCCTAFSVSMGFTLSMQSQTCPPMKTA